MTTKVNERMIVPETWSTAILIDSNSEPNTNKWLGKAVFISDTNIPVWSTGTLNVSPWVDSSGTTVITPM